MVFSAARWTVWSLFLFGCATQSRLHRDTPARLLPKESPALSDLRQLTFGGENAEAYWSFDGTQLSFQARHDDHSCDRIYRMTPGTAGVPSPLPVSSGQGATTCAHFFPDGDLLYASTHLAGPTCPPRPDMSHGYVWALHDSYDIFASAPDGSHLRRLTASPGYDAEGTVCARDGSVVFTSTRGGDIELYRMDKDGGNVRRLTHTPGYDGGAFFNRDCTKIVWRAGRPRAGAELDDYRSLLARGLVRPTELELWIANADGSDPMQITHLHAASFAPSFHPTENLIIFASNYGDAAGREFDLWTVHPDGSQLHRVTHAPGFDGFPHFSPDGQWLAFSSNRATAPGQHDTNVFVARWHGVAPTATASGADRIAEDIAWLADPARQGRGIGTSGLQQAATYLADRLQHLGLQGAGDAGAFPQTFPVVTSLAVSPSTRVQLGDVIVTPDQISVMGYSTEQEVNGPLVLAGYGLREESLGIDDYAGRTVRGAVVMVRRFVPDDPRLSEAGNQRRLGDIRRKAWLARENGALALVVVDWPSHQSGSPAEAALLSIQPEGAGDAGIPVIMVKRSAIATLTEALEKGLPLRAHLKIALTKTSATACNIIGRISAGHPSASPPIVIGAHYDHLGYGGRFSLAPGAPVAHPGADDNASGTATVLEIARQLAERRQDLTRDVLIMLFSGEEWGLLGSGHFIRTEPPERRRLFAMINLDMVGRLRDQRLEVLGTDSATEWNSLLATSCARQKLTCAMNGDGYGPSDHASFYGAGLPVLHLFTGSHTDYHRPSDTADKINAGGAAQVADLVTDLVTGLDQREPLTFRRTDRPSGGGDSRSFGASLGTIPDYGGPPQGQTGVLLAGVRIGGAAERAGMKRGDILVRLGDHAIRSVEDLMYALNASKPGETVTAVVSRQGQSVKLLATFQPAAPR